MPEHASVRDDVYEEVEVDCITGMEWDLHLLIADQTMRHVEQLLTTNAKHPTVKEKRLVAKFHDKNILLRNMFSVRLKKWSNDIIASYNQVKEVRQSRCVQVMVDL